MATTTTGALGGSLQLRRRVISHHPMEAAALWTAGFASLFVFFLIPLAFFFGRHYKGRELEKPPLPPSPPSWIPVLGHLHLVKPPVHSALAELSRRHAAPVLLLRLGTRRALVVSSPAAVEECFTANDVAFASRPRSLAGRHLSYDNTTVTTAPYGRLWRDLRRVATVEVLSARRLHGFSPVRSEEVRSLVRRLFVGAGGGGGPPPSSPPAWVKAELSAGVFGLALNVMTRMTAGRRYYGEGPEGTEAARGFQEIVEESLRLRGVTNRWDFLPWLRWVDLRGVERRMRRLRRTRDAFLQRLVDEHRSRRRREKDDGDGERRTAVEVMLSLQESDPGFYTDDIIKSFVVVLPPIITP
uniref:Isoflavone 2'-hydroxylase n=1 Tax=Anthurium amnicola TaxID=1678845 RepID=A0A1D1ZG00_9ARAE